MDDDILWRVCLFMVGCMGTRFALTYLAKCIPLVYLPIMGVPALAIALSFATIYAMGWRKTGPEVRGDRIWWNSLRPIHAALWFTFAVLAFAGRRDAWIALLVDTLVGLTAFVFYHLFVRVS
jgi:hypothetical protein